MGRWLVRLEGDPFDLEEFPVWFPDGDTFVLEEEGAYYLCGPLLDEYASAQEVHDGAIQLVDEMFAVGSLLMGSLQRPSVGSVTEIDSTGARHTTHMLQVDAVVARTKASVVILGPDGASDEHEPGPTSAQQMLDRAQGDVHLGHAVTLWADPLRSWPRLYRTLEEVEQFLGHTVDAAGYCSAGERKRFTRSANAAEVAGKDSRHASGKFTPPSSPMSLHEAQEFIGRMLSSALSSNTA